jgi:hypothetical protein
LGRSCRPCRPCCTCSRERGGPWPDSSEVLEQGRAHQARALMLHTGQQQAVDTHSLAAGLARAAARRVDRALAQRLTRQRRVVACLTKQRHKQTGAGTRKR